MLARQAEGYRIQQQDQPNHQDEYKSAAFMIHYPARAAKEERPGGHHQQQPFVQAGLFVELGIGIALPFVWLVGSMG